MTTQTLALTDFLLARIAEDEAVAQAAGGHGLTEDASESLMVDWFRWEPDEFVPEMSTVSAAHIARHDPARVLAECEAKRVQVRFLSDLDGHRLRDVTNGISSIAYSILCRMAQPYADHPD